MNLVSNIKILCKEKDTSIPKLEKVFGFGNGSIYNWDKSFPSADKLAKVADYFNVSVDFLMGRTEYRNAHLITEFVDGDKIEIEMDDAYFNKLSPGEVRQFLKSLRDAGFDLEKLTK